MSGNTALRATSEESLGRARSAPPLQRLRPDAAAQFRRPSASNGRASRACMTQGRCHGGVGLAGGEGAAAGGL